MLRRCLCLAFALAAAEPTNEQLLARTVQLEEQVAALQQGLRGLESRRLGDDLTDVETGFKTALDNMWLILCGALVMFMQAGFAMLEAGTCRFKNAGIVLMKNVLDACLGCFVWYLLGYGLAYGAPEDPNTFIGGKHFAGTDFDLPGNEFHYRDWFFQWAFCATAATIVSGAVAERISLAGYVIYSAVMTGFIYPVIVWWTWSGKGWLTEEGYSDFAGSGIVHLTGGIAAFVGALILGPRKGRWEAQADGSKDFDPHNMGLVVLGTFVLWFGWYGFNCGSTLSFSDAATANNGALVAMNTTIAAAMGGLTVFVFRFVKSLLLGSANPYDLGGACNGILAGLVGVCAGVGSIYPHGALLIGILAALGEELGSTVVKLLKVDDPLDAFAVHGCGGIVGLIMAPLVHIEGVQGKMLGAHLIGILAIVAWSGGLSAITFFVLRVLGALRIGAEEEEEGCDAKLAQGMTSPRTGQKPWGAEADPKTTQPGSAAGGKDFEI